MCQSLSGIWLFVTPWTVARQAPLFMGFCKQEYWSGLPFSSPGDLPHPGTEPRLLHCRQIFYHLSHQRNIYFPLKMWNSFQKEFLNCTYLLIPMEKAMAPHSSTPAWKIPWTEEPGRLQSMGSLRVGHDWATSLSCIGEGNGNPLQCSCLENPRDGEAWWAAVYGVAQSRTRLTWLSSLFQNVVTLRN